MVRKRILLCLLFFFFFFFFFVFVVLIVILDLVFILVPSVLDCVRRWLIENRAAVKPPSALTLALACGTTRGAC